MSNRARRRNKIARKVHPQQPRTVRRGMVEQPTPQENDSPLLAVNKPYQEALLYWQEVVADMPEDLIPKVNEAAHATLQKLFAQAGVDDQIIILRKGNSEEPGDPHVVLMSYATYQEYQKADEAIEAMKNGSRRFGDLEGIDLPL